MENDLAAPKYLEQPSIAPVQQNTEASPSKKEIAHESADDLESSNYSPPQVNAFAEKEASNDDISGGIAIDSEFTKEQDAILMENYIKLSLEHGEQYAVNQLVSLLDYCFSTEQIKNRFGQLIQDQPEREWTEYELAYCQQNCQQDIM